MPEWRAELRRLLAGLGLPPTREAEIVEELSQHLEDRYQELRAHGASEAEASRLALDEVRDGETLGPALAGVERRASPGPIPLGSGSGHGRLSRLGRDLRFGLRMLRTRPVFTLVAVLTLALGIGATTAIFSVVNAVLLRSLPYPESDRLVAFWGTAPEKRLPVVAFPDALFLFYRQQSRRFESVAAYSSVGLNLSGGDGEPERINAGAVTLDFFRVMGVQPVRGRGFVSEEGLQGRNRVVVLGDAIWRRRFGGDPQIVGKPITINGVARIVVGVMPPGFDFPERTQLWYPLVLNPEGLDSWHLPALGRLKPGQTMEEARREIANLTDEFMLRRPARFPDAKHGGARIVAKSLQANLVGELETPLLILLGAVGLVLLIASANIANLMLARAASRAREMAVRCCMGASPRRIAAQLFTESLLLAGAGAAGGVLLALWGIALLRRSPLPAVPGLDQVRLDPAVLGFTLGITLLTALIFGLAPALRASRVELQDALREGARGGSSGASRRLTQVFVVSQFALSLILLIGAGLLLRSFRHLLDVNPGFRAEQVLTARIQLPGSKYDSGTKITTFYDRLMEAMGGSAGVVAVGINEQIPFTGGNSQQELYVEGQEPKAGDAVPVVNTRSVSPGYFQAMGTPIVKGRAFLASDLETTLPVVIVDETVARHYWPGADPIGRRIKTSSDSDAVWLTIVGVVPNVKQQSLSERPDFQLYQPFAQMMRWSAYLVVRTTAGPEAFASLLKRRLAEIDPTLPISELRTLQDAVDASLATRRLTNTLLAGFALLALLLAAIGIYGVMALSVAGRSSEFGVRLALGAAPSSVLRLVIGQGLLLAAIGVGVGLAGAVGVTRLLRTLLFEVQPLDLPTFAGVAIALSGVAILACYLPARRATQADPIAVLRRE
jgi:putative ABC transport system permease protein